MTHKKIAIVHDDFIQWGGAERLVAALAELFPDAPIYTSMADPKILAKARIDSSRLVTSGLQRIPLKKYLNKAIFPVYPMFFENFDLTGFDLVISSSTRFAHGVITKPGTQHIAYINSPFRGFWEPDLYFGRSRLPHFLAPVLLSMRNWDYIAGQRPDVIVANSRIAQARVQKYYRRSAQVIHPFVDLHRFENEKKPSFPVPAEYYLMVSRLVEWKKLNLAVMAFNQTRQNLIVVGEGPFKSKLMSLAGPSVQMVGFLDDAETTYLMRRARALIHPQKEDFGMTVVEANACGTPVIAFQQGGALDTVQEGKTGIFFSEQTVAALAKAIEKFNPLDFDQNQLIQHAQGFRREVFVQRWQNLVQELLI